MAKKAKEPKVKLKFDRKTTYSDTTIEFLRALIAKEKELKKENKIPQGNGLMIVPNEKSVKVYYMGKTFLEEVADKKCKLFPKESYSAVKKTMNYGYNQYFVSDAEKAVLKKLREKEITDSRYATKEQETAIHTCILEHMDTILNCIKRGMASQIEREFQNIIALNHVNYQMDSYSVCGFECAVSGTVFEEDAKPEIDLIAFHPAENKLLLIEYKCTQSALIEGPQHIGKHCKDYVEICFESAKEREDFPFLEKLLACYNLMSKIYCDDESYKEKTYISIDVKSNPDMGIVFLITDSERGYKDSAITTSSINSDNLILESDYATAQGLVDAYFSEAKDDRKPYEKKIQYLVEKYPADVKIANFKERLVEKESEE